MEVHKHPHHVTHTKKWFEYLLEFIMLFLAVYLGFVAENIRENAGERQKEREYVVEFLQDLKNDTAQLNLRIKANIKKGDAYTKLLYMAHSNLTDSINVRKVYNYFRDGASYQIFYPSDATISQLKNGGGFRLINKEITDSILSYDSYNKRILVHNDLYLNVYNGLWDAAYKIMDLNVWVDTTYSKNHLSVTKFSWTSKPLPALSSDKLDLKVFFGILTRMIGINDFSKNYMIEQNQKAQRLITLLNNKYHIEE